MNEGLHQCSLCILLITFLLSLSLSLFSPVIIRLFCAWRCRRGRRESLSYPHVRRGSRREALGHGTGCHTGGFLRR